MSNTPDYHVEIARAKLALIEELMHRRPRIRTEADIPEMESRMTIFKSEHVWTARFRFEMKGMPRLFYVTSTSREESLLVWDPISARVEIEQEY